MSHLDTKQTLSLIEISPKSVLNPPTLKADDSIDEQVLKKDNLSDWRRTRYCCSERILADRSNSPWYYKLGDGSGIHLGTIN